MTRHVRVRPRRGIAVIGALALVAVMMTPAGAYPRPGATERVSVASDGTQQNGNSYIADISADGRYVAFGSNASNLVSGDTNDTFDIFVHDRETGDTERVSVASDGTQGNALSINPSISADGRHVVFLSGASNLVPDDTNDAWDVFVHDRQTGVTERVSVATDGTQGNGPVDLTPAISADGRHVVFSGFASNLVPDDTNNAPDVFVHDRDAGITERVSVTSDGSEADHWSVFPAVSADGRYVVFSSFASNLARDDTNGSWDVFVHDRETGTTERVSVVSDGTQGNDASYIADISADGRYVAFESAASNLVPTDTNGAWDVFVHDRQTGATERVSVASDGAERDGDSIEPSISADGRQVAFFTASDLIPDPDDPWNVFVHDRRTATTERVSVAADGTEGNHHSFAPAFSADGRHLAFSSAASNLVPGDTNGVWDIFVRERGPATGIGALGVQTAQGQQLDVSGWATFSGATVATAEDPADDGEVGARELGAEIVGASVTHRPEQEDLLLGLQLASLPEGGAPGVVYRWGFTVGETAYEVRAMATAVTGDPPTTDPHFALYECADSCTEATPLSGGIGTTGAEVRVSVPLVTLGAEAGTGLTDVEASAALGEAAPGPLVVLDDVALPDASIPVARVELGIAPASASQADVVFSAQADLVEGRFSGTLDASSLPPGAHRVWARACLGETCGAQWVEVAP